MKRAILTIAVAACWAGTCFGELQSKLEESRAREGSPGVPEGAKLTLELPNGGPWEIGEPVPAILRLTNQGSAAFIISTGGDYRGIGYPLRCKVEGIAPDESVLPDESENAMYFGGISFNTEVLPGKSVDVAFPLLAFVNFTKPGTYQIRATHDFGWKVDENRPHPIAEAEVEITLPSEVSARNRVEALLALDDKFRCRDELGRLRAPVYLPALLDAAKAGQARAIAGLASIPGIEATERLIELAGSEYREVAVEASRTLRTRISDEILQTHSGIAWKASQSESALKLARQLLADADDLEQISQGAWVVAALGQPDEMPKVQAAMQALFDRLPKNRNSREGYLHSFGLAIDALLRAVDALLERGNRTDANWSGTAGIAIGFRQLALTWQNPEDYPAPQTDRWKQSLRAFSSQNPNVLRQLAMEAIPAGEGELDDVIRERLEDADYGVARAACEAAGRTANAKTFVSDLLQVVESHEHPTVISAAAAVCEQQGAGSKLADALAERLIDEHLDFKILELLLGLVLEPGNGSGGNSNIPRADRFVLREAWREFLAQHREKLDRGERFGPDSAELPAELVGRDTGGLPYLSISYADGKNWPAAP